MCFLHYQILFISLWYQIVTKQFKEKNPELLNLQKEIQINRYDFFENLRLNKILEIKQVKNYNQNRKGKE